MNKRSEEETSQIVAKSLQLVLSGKSSIEAILFRYPDMVDVLRPELETAVYLTQISPQFGPSPGFLKTSKSRLMERIEQEAAYEKAAYGRSAPARARPGPARSDSLAGQSWIWRFASMAVIIIVLFMSFTGTVYAAKDTVPGDGLYGFKRWTEDTTYSLTFDMDRQVQLRLAFSSRRLDEANVLIARGQTDLVGALMADYEMQVEQAVVVLRNLEQTQDGDTDLMAEYALSELDRQSERLSKMAANTNENNSEALLQAMEASKRGSEKAEEMSGKPKPTNPKGASTQEVPAAANTPEKGNEPDKVPPGSNQPQTDETTGPKENPGQGKDKENPGQDKDKENPGQGNDKGVKTPEPEGEKQPQGKPTTNSSDSNEDSEKKTNDKNNPSDGKDKPSDGKDNPSDGKNNPSDGKDKPSDGKDKPGKP